MWKSVELPSRAPPLTRRLVRSMAAFEWSQDNFEMALVLLLAFHCLLRTGEVLQLTPYDFSVGNHTAICRLQSTKSGQRNSVDEVITVGLLRLFLSVRRQLSHMSIPLWSGSSATFRNRFRHLCHLMDLGKHGLRPYSLRPGGATEFFQRTRSMEVTLLRGRWQIPVLPSCIFQMA